MSDTLDILARALEGRYALQGELGAGGMAVVYLATDVRHGRRVALKVIREDLADIEGVRRFLHEIGVTARLNHPHILPLLDSGEVDGVPFFVMPYIEGETLRRRMDRLRPLPIDDALAIAADIVDALAYAHAQDVLHRDIKPENIMFSGRHALVADFGIAKAMQLAASDEHSTQVTQTGRIVGTPAYMSPEQSAGDETIDGRSDVYSTGVVLYEMLAGAAPFAGPSPRSIFSRRLTEDPPSLHVQRADAPPIVEQVVMRALARDPSRRYASAAEFADAIASTRRTLAASGSRTLQLMAEPPVMPSIAILPFSNLSADPENEYLSDGITEEILSALSRLRSIRVCARASSFAFKGQNIDVRAVGERLGVRSVLTGSVRRAGLRLRVNAQLVNAADGFQLWAERYERASDDVFAIEDDISSAIVSALRTTLAVPSNTHAPAAMTSPHIEAAANSEAHEAVLKGRFALARRTEEQLRRAIEEFQRAATIDTRYAAAHAGLADAWALLAVYGAAAPQEAMPAALRAAERAASLQPSIAEPHAAIGLVRSAFDWQWEEAELAFARSIAANSRYPAAHQWLATNVLVPQRRFDEALESIGRAMRLDPLAVSVKTALISVLFYSRRYAEAVDAARDLVLIEPASALAHYFAGQALIELGDTNGATAAMERAVERSGQSSETIAALGFACGRAGDRDRAGHYLGVLRQRASERYVSPGHFALLHVGLGEPDRALDQLEAASEARATDLIWLGVRPAWDVLRTNARFAALLGTMRLKP
jgi:serine/threonine-protein kinase